MEQLAPMDVVAPTVGLDRLGRRVSAARQEIRRKRLKLESRTRHLLR